MKKKDILLLIISGFILVVAWIVFSIYHNLATSTISSTVGNQLQPIQATFDMQTINTLKGKTKIPVDYSQLDSKTSTKSSPISPSPAITVSPTSTQSAQGGKL